MVPNSRPAVFRATPSPASAAAPRSRLARAYVLVRMALGLVFVVAGALKLSDPRAFAQVIAGYGLLPNGFSGLAALVLPGAEILAGLALALDVRGGLSGVAGMLLLFMAVLGYGLHLGLDVDCGCFAPGDPEAEAYHGLGQALARDAGMLAACLFLHLCRRRMGIRPRTLGGLAFQRFTRHKENPTCVH
jgi:uncharacterized membrane protein YphA (DoxX/SURF4 family)